MFVMFLIDGSSEPPSLAEECDDEDLLLLELLARDRFDTSWSGSDRLTGSLPRFGFFGGLELPAGEWVGEVFIGGVLGDCSIW